MAYDPTFKPVYFVTKFVEGLKHEIRSAILLQRPGDLDAACTLAFLQEEALEGDKGIDIKKGEGSGSAKHSVRVALPLPTPPTVKGGSPSFAEERRISDNGRSQNREMDRLATLKAYRRSKGLCFTCGEKWGREHKCASSIQLHVVQELLAVLQGPDISSEEFIVQSDDSLMAISIQAINATESNHSIRLRGWLQGIEVLMLVDSGSTHSFVDHQLGLKLTGVKSMASPARVKVADGGHLNCSLYVNNCDWLTQGIHFKSNFRLLSLGTYDVILGMDWLEQFSPMKVDWVQKWLEFQFQGSTVRLQGIQSHISSCLPITPDQLTGLLKSGSALFLIHLDSNHTSHITTIPAHVQPLLDEFQSVFQEPTELPPKRLCDHKIPLLPGSKAVFIRPYRHTPAQKDEIERQVKEMLQNGIIQHSSSPFSSPALLVKKKDGSWRVCIDYRQLNAITKKGTYPMPIIDELLDELAGAKIFSKLDLRAGYHQIRMAEGEEFKTAFQTHSGHYEYKVMSFGLTGAPATFQGAMNDTLRPLLRKCALVFFDDILIYSPDMNSHLDHLKQVLQLLATHQWKVKLSKCDFAQTQISYLGYIISGQGVSTDPSKIQSIVDWAVPTTLKKLRGFLGLAGYYRKFVKDFGTLSKPLTQLLKKDAPFVWSAEVNQAFQALKHALTSTPVLALPNFQQGFTIETDASDIGIGAVLSQNQHPVAFVSKALGPRTQGLSTYEKECLAIMMAVDHWRPYLQFQEFLIITDHHSLMHLTEQRLHTPWQQKAFTKLSGLQFQIVYRKGKHNAAADALSRHVPEETSEFLGISTCSPVWLQDILHGYDQDPLALSLLTGLAVNPSSYPHYSLSKGLIKHKGKVWVGNNSNIQQQIISALHDSPLGGHSGFPVTYKRIKSLFSWPHMKLTVQKQLASCAVCLQAKPDRSKYPGLLQPLPVPDGAWQIISMDFIEGLPKSYHQDCILVVVDKFSKYAHFMPLYHPFSALDVAKVFMLNVYKLHGLPQIIISDRDKIFTSALWEQLFLRSGTKLHLSSAYHPQSDGQTERVNQCLEIFLRCFVHATPAKWSLWLHLAEFWYKSSYHSALNKTPFEVLYGYPPSHFGIRADACVISDLDSWLSERHLMTQLLRQHLNRAQQVMKTQADKKRSFRSFQVGDWVFLKLQPYV